MEKQFTFRQKKTDLLIGNIVIGEDGAIRYTLPEDNGFFDSAYPGRVLERIVADLHDSFGRVHAFEMDGDRLAINAQRPFLIPGQDEADKIRASFSAYAKRILEPIYEIRETSSE